MTWVIIEILILVTLVLIGVKTILRVIFHIIIEMLIRIFCFLNKAII